MKIEDQLLESHNQCCHSSQPGSRLSHHNQLGSWLSQDNRNTDSLCIDCEVLTVCDAFVFIAGKVDIDLQEFR